LQVNGRLARHQFGRATQHAHCRLWLAERQQAGSLEQMRRPEGWIDPGRCPELHKGVGVPSPALQDNPQIVVNEGAVTAAADHGAKRRFGLVQTASRQVGNAFREPRRQRGRQVLRGRPGRRRHQQSQCQRQPEH
jgi:hypothetical protein